MRPYILRNQIRPYAWGSRDFIAAMRGLAVPSAAPEAEMWMGAHPQGSSEIEDGGSRSASLAERIEADPVAFLGAEISARFGGELPFLMKVLAAAEPLSLQAHPDRAQAEAGFAAEDRAGVPLSSPARCYRDRHPKPELIVALTTFDALCGFRPVVATRDLLRRLAVPELAVHAATLERFPPATALRLSFEALLTADLESQRRIAAATGEGIARAAREIAGARIPAGEPLAAEVEWMGKLAALYPGDIGVVCALFLNLIRLRPHDALYLSAGNLHAYLAGAGVEIMASSDNVLRGGLTQKRVNVPELLRVLKFEELSPEPVRAVQVDREQWLYPTPAQEFELSRYEIGVDGVPRAGNEADREGRGADDGRTREGPEIWLVTEGQIELLWSSGSVALLAGSSAFIPAGLPAGLPAGSPGLTWRGKGTAFRARVPSSDAPIDLPSHLPILGEQR